MAISVGCTFCGRYYNVGDDMAGRTVRCTNCQETFRIPLPEEISDELPDLTVLEEVEPPYAGTPRRRAGTPRRARRRTHDTSENSSRYEALVRESSRQFRYPPDPKDARALCECLRDHCIAVSVLAQGLENCPGGQLRAFSALAREAAVAALDIDFALNPWAHGPSNGKG